jgi:nicotinamide phosphoribosyltransferase
MKASAIKIGGEWRDVYKAPATDPDKASKPGRLALRKGPQGFETLRLEHCRAAENRVIPVFRDGKLLKQWTFAEIRALSDEAY